MRLHFFVYTPIFASFGEVLAGKIIVVNASLCFTIFERNFHNALGTIYEVRDAFFVRNSSGK